MTQCAWPATRMVVPASAELDGAAAARRRDDADGRAIHKAQKRSLARATINH
jgi:hypothetical protein